MKSTRFVSGVDIGKSICEAIGIDPAKVHSMIIRIVPNAPVEIEIGTWTTQIMADGLEREFKAIRETYHLVKKED